MHRSPPEFYCQIYLFLGKITLRTYQNRNIRNLSVLNGIFRKRFRYGLTV